MIKKVIFVFINITVLIANMFAQKNIDIDKDAITIKKFANYTTWPSDDKFKNQNNFILAVLNDSMVVNQFSIFFNQDKILNKTISVKNITQPDQILDCHLLYIPNGTEKLVYDAIKITSNMPILTICKSRELVEKGIILYFKQDKETTIYGYNRKSLLGSGIFIRSTLLIPDYQVDK